MQEPIFLSDIPEANRLVTTDTHSGPKGTIAVITREPLEFEKTQGGKTGTVRAQKFYLLPKPEPPMDKKQILEEFRLFSLRTGGIGSWLTENTDDEVFERLGRIGETPLTKVQLNQLLAFGHEAPVSDDFFRYYWLTAPPEHPYEVKALPHFEEAWERASAITSLAHLKWGLYRLFTDGLLGFGNVRTAYRKLRSMTREELSAFFARRRFNTKLIKERGPALP